MLCLCFTDGLCLETHGIYCAYTDHLSSAQTKGLWLLEMLDTPHVLYSLIWAHAENVSEIFTLPEQSEPLKSQIDVINCLT